MYAFVPNYTRIRAHKHVPQVTSLGVHETGGALRVLVPKTYYIIYYVHIRIVAI